MPIFKMKCRQCGEIFEVLFKSSNTQAVCNKCSSSDLEKLPSEIAVVNKSNPCLNAPVCPGASCCGGKCGGHL